MNEYCEACGFDRASCICSLIESEIEGEDEPVAFNRGRGNGGEQKPKYEHKENRDSMFVNDNIENDKSPDFKGSINVKGTVYWINGWKNASDGGKKYISLSVQEQEAHMRDRGERQPQAKPQRRGDW